MQEVLHCLSESTALITPRGINFRNMYYSCPEAISYQWFASCDQNTQIPILYSENCNVIQLLLPDGELITAHMIPEVIRPVQDELKDYFNKLNALKKSEKKRKLGDKNMKNFTWNSTWILPYESGWSIFEKFKQANVINSRELLKEFGTSSVVKLKGDIIGRRRRDLLNLEGFNHQYLEKTLGVDIYKHTQYYLMNMVGMFSSKTKFRYLIREVFTYCTECLRRGYHSLLHQFQFVDRCPYHMSELNNICTSCGHKMFFELSNHKHSGGFLCRCSKSLVTIEEYDSSTWSCHLPIQDKQLTNWLKMDSRMAEKLRNTYIYFPSLVTNPKPFEFLLNYHSH